MAWSAAWFVRTRLNPLYLAVVGGEASKLTSGRSPQSLSQKLMSPHRNKLVAPGPLLTEFL